MALGDDDWRSDPQQRYDRLYGRKKYCPHGLRNYQCCRDCERDHPFSMFSQNGGQPRSSPDPFDIPSPDASQRSEGHTTDKREVSQTKWGNLHTATNLKDLKKSYKSLAKKYHPDKGGTDEEFQDLQWMYERLLDRLKIQQEYNE